MKINNMFIAIRTVIILLLLTACNILKPISTPPPGPTPTAVVMPVTGVQYYFVTNKLLLPISQKQTQAFALNIDGDSQQHLDNRFGELLALLTSAAPTLELQSTLDQVINTGKLVTLHVVKADDTSNDPSVSWSVFQGQKTQSAPSFDGTDKFTLDSVAPIESPIVGSLTNGHFTGSAGATRVQMILLGQQVDVDLIGVHLEADLGGAGCSNGKLGGGVTIDEFRSKLLPAIGGGFNQIIKTNNAASNTLSQFFDLDRNGTITTQELESNPLLMMAISPDLDLLDAAGKFNPNQDGVKDSYSLGLGFTCVPAAFAVPESILVP